jgi:SAM-dependent methyltransferase
MKVKNCRLCKSENLYEFLDLGGHPHSDQFRKTNDEPEMRYPLRLVMCRDCGLAQLSYVVEPEEMYTKDYLYEASITKTADKHWGELADDVIAISGIKSGRAIDIGGNDGTLSLKFKERGFTVLNIDPCEEVANISRTRGVETITAFFNKNLKTEPADIVTGTNVFAHINDLDSFAEALLSILKPNGIFVFESPYFGEFLKGLEYDTVYHQHLSYLSLKPLIPFLAKYGLEIFDVKFSELHGGAFRCYIARQGQRTVNPIVFKSVSKETWSEEYLMKWGVKCQKHRDELFDLVYDLYKQGRTICCVSAPAKGQTLLNYTGIGRFISFVTEKSKLKIGRYTPGTKIKIVGDEELHKADYALILAWNFAEEIMSNNKDYKGTWIIPLPNICTKTNEE